MSKKSKYKLIKSVFSLWVHLTSRRKAHFKGLFVLMLISALAEMVSIGVIFPFLGVITNPEAVFTHHLVQPVNSFFKVNSAVDLRLIVTSLFIAIVVLAGLIRILLIFVSTRLMFAVGARRSDAQGHHPNPD